MNAVTDFNDTVDWLRGIAPAAQLALDSRRIQRGDIFLACRGENGDGRDYIAQAIEAGASAILFDSADGFAWPQAWSTPHRAVPQLAALAGRLAHHWYREPDAGLFSVAVTGTNGKTSCTQWLGQALSREKLPTVVIGTLGVGLFRRGGRRRRRLFGRRLYRLGFHRRLGRSRGRRRRTRTRPATCSCRSPSCSS